MTAKTDSSRPRLLVDVQGACDALVVGRTTLTMLVRGGHLVPIRIGRAVRFAVADIEAFVERQRGAEAGNVPAESRDRCGRGTCEPS